MPAPEAVRATAISRDEVRKSIKRMEFHLARGPRGLRGVTREVAFLDALHRQTARLGGRAVGASVATHANRSFGADTLRALRGSNKATIGRVKSSVLADFSADGLEGPRSIATVDGSAWVWTANSSACPTCLSEHGEQHTGEFVPMHPSCLCIPEEPSDAIRPLTAKELAKMNSKYGDPRYAKAVADVLSGQRTMQSLRSLNNVNRQLKGRKAVAKHRGQGIGRQSALGGGEEAVLLPNADVQAAARLKAQQAAEEAAKVVRLSADDAAALAKAAIDDVAKLADDAAEAVFVKHPKEYGFSMPRAKDRARLIEQAFEKMNEVSPALRAQYDDLLKAIYEGRGLKFTTATKSTKGMGKLGSTAIQIDRRGGGLIEGTMRMELQLMREHPEFDAWRLANNAIAKKARNRAGGDLSEWTEWLVKNPKPTQWRLATADELADTMMHELGHAADYAKNYGSNTYGHIPAAIKQEIRDMGWSGKAPGVVYDDLGKPLVGKGNQVVTVPESEVGKRLLSYDYALSEPAESIAELHRFYFRGVGQSNLEGIVPGYTGAAEDVFLTAEQWRKANPKLAAWLKEEFNL